MKFDLLCTMLRQYKEQRKTNALLEELLRVTKNSHNKLLSQQAAEENGQSLFHFVRTVVYIPNFSSRSKQEHISCARSPYAHRIQTQVAIR